MHYYILLLMVFLHITDDYYLQGILASMKQKQWWADQIPNMFYPKNPGYKYRYDYFVALFMHSFSWAFMIMLPFYKLAMEGNTIFLALFAFNVVIHAMTDDFKANVKVINLITDQSIHLAQIAFTFYILSSLT